MRYLKEGEIILYGTEITTDIHSNVSLQSGENTYITINQMSNIILDNIRVLKEEINTDFYIVSGYTILSVKDTKSYKNKINIRFASGNIVLRNASGEVYLRKETGCMVTSNRGKIIVNTNLFAKNILTKGERCIVLKNGYLIENEQIQKEETISPDKYFSNDNYYNFTIKKFHYYYTENLTKPDFSKR